jgi:hypothetical protein
MDRGNALFFTLVQFGTYASSKRKLIQFANIFHSLNHNQLMIDFKSLRDMYVLLCVNNNLRRTLD